LIPRTKSRFVEIWNGIPGQTPVKKFQDRKKAVARVWSAIQPLAGKGQPSESAAEKPRVRRTRALIRTGIRAKTR
jgi:hypothetical protein